MSMRCVFATDLSKEASLVLFKCSVINCIVFEIKDEDLVSKVKKINKSCLPLHRRMGHLHAMHVLFIVVQLPFIFRQVRTCSLFIYNLSPLQAIGLIHFSSMKEYLTL